MIPYALPLPKVCNDFVSQPMHHSIKKINPWVYIPLDDLSDLFADALAFWWVTRRSQVL
jgi:hypothetical protein